MRRWTWRPSGSTGRLHPADMEKKIRAALVFLFVLCLFLSVGAAEARADSDGAATVTASALNMRSEPSTSSSVVTCLPRGTIVVAHGSSDGWVSVSYKDYTGYMSAEYLSMSDSAEADLGTGTVTGSDVRLRSGPGTSYDILGTRGRGDTLQVTGVSGAWYKVSVNGSTAYISSTYLSLGSSGSSSSGASGSSSVSGTGTISGTGVRLRSGPGTTYSILGSFNTGETMAVTGGSGDWYSVTHNGTDGYVYKTYLKLGEADSSSSGGISVSSLSEFTAYVISPVHMRNGPDTSYTSQRVLPTGESVTVTGESGKWYRVTYGGNEGYIFKTYLSSSAVSSSSSSGEGARIAAEAKNYLGVPYVYGGTSPSGFDCSGFVYYVYRQCGYSITRTATAQNGNGSYVSRSSLQPGDIIIFYNSAMTGIGHSGIYIGDGQFIHASSGSGKVVISNLNTNSYYNTHYYSARRVV